MSESKQLFNKHDEKVDSIIAQLDTAPVGMGNGLNKAAIGAVVGAFVGTVAGALANKKTAHSIKHTVIGAGDAIKGAAQGVNDTVKRAGDAVKATVQGVTKGVNDTVIGTEGVAQGVNDTVIGTVERVKHTVEDAKPSDYQSFKLYEERLVADKKQVKTAEISIGKHVETQMAHISVPVKKERVVVEPTTPVDAGTPVAPGEANFHEGEIARMEIYEEKADVYKQAFVREEFSVRKQVEHDTVEVEDQVRREELYLDTQDPNIIDETKI